jgi:hypothetical protein
MVGIVSNTLVTEVLGAVEVDIVVAGGAALVLVFVAVVIFNM